MQLSDELGRRMLKLYDQSKPTLNYWEAWEDGYDVVIHWGEIGSEGTTRRETIPRSQTAENVITAAAEEPRRNGFAEIPIEQHAEIVVHRRLDAWGSTADLELRHDIEDLLNEQLGWLGLGHCDGGDIGSGSINIYSYVVDPGIGARAVVAALKESELLEGSIVAVREGEDYRVVHPGSYTGSFEPLAVYVANPFPGTGEAQVSPTKPQSIQTRELQSQKPWWKFW
jgi:predicted DNA-binding WGR domain protein